MDSEASAGKATQQRAVSDQVEAFLCRHYRTDVKRERFRATGFFWSPKARSPQLYVWRVLDDGSKGWRLASVGA